MMFLKAGDIVDIVFPATCCSNEEIMAIKNYLQNKIGLTPRILLENIVTPTIKENIGNCFPSYDITPRFEQLYQALNNSQSKIVWCAKGGYGSGDLLPLLEKAQKLKQNKLFIGFSDITSIALFIQQKWNWKTITAPMLLQLAKNSIEQKAQDQLKALIFGEKTELSYNLTPLNSGFENKPIEAEITGGCLSVLAGHFGGSYQIDFADKILFLEDQAEEGEKLDRYFRQIIEIILKTGKAPKAIILGNFMNKSSSITPDEQNVRIAFQRMAQKIEQFNLKIPLLEETEKSLGHSSNMRPLILGTSTEISFDKYIKLQQIL